MASQLGIAGATFLLSFAVGLLICGLFGSYFGRGRSRSVGILIALFAVLLIGAFTALTWEIVPGLTPVFDSSAVARSFLSVTIATAGTLLAVGSFITIQMRS